MAAIPPLEEVAQDTSIWTNALKKKIRDESEKNLYFFAKSVCWYHDLAPCHKKLCDSLDGRGDWGPDWVRATITAHRGWLKSSIVRAWAIRNGLHSLNWSCRYFGASLDAAEENFLRPISLLFTQDTGAEFRLWLYEDRIPKNFEGWTEDTVALVQTDAKAPPTLTIRGVTSKREGFHGRCLILDDIEGAEADKKVNEQVDAMNFISSATPLLIDPGKDRIVNIGTVHGEDPIVYRLLHENLDPKAELPTGQPELDNTKRVWKVFWQPLYNGDGKANWPQRFTEETIETIKRGTNPDVWAKQYLLLRGSVMGSTWKRRQIEFLKAKWKEKGKSVVYPFLEIDLDVWKREGKLKSNWTEHEVRLDEMLYTMHLDPKHQAVTGDYRRTNVRPAKAAIVIVGTCPDGHQIVIDEWADEVGIDQQIEQLYKMHRKWGCRALTLDPIGAQQWISNMLVNAERYNPTMHKVMGRGLFGGDRQLPRLSSILHEDKRSTRMPKEDHIFGRLDPLISTGQLHYLDGLDMIFNQTVGFPNESDYIDVIDALAQGASTDSNGRPIWQAPIGRKEHEAFRAGQRILRDKGLMQTHYRAPGRAPKPQVPIHPQLQKRAT